MFGLQFGDRFRLAETGEMVTFVGSLDHAILYTHKKKGPRTTGDVMVCDFCNVQTITWEEQERERKQR